MLEIKPFRQKPSCCGAAALKMVLEYFNIIKSEKELIRLSGASLAKGIEALQLLKAAKKLGLRGFFKDNAELSDIRRYVIKKKLPVIVDWFWQDDGHFGVVIGIDKENIYLQDPELGHVRAMKREDFKRVWFDFPDKYMKTKDDLFLRRMLVIRR
jgi:predicted double-glycine peptidase